MAIFYPAIACPVVLIGKKNKSCDSMPSNFYIVVSKLYIRLQKHLFLSVEKFVITAFLYGTHKLHECLLSVYKQC